MRHLRHPVRIGLAVFFLILGIIGGFVPVLQGWIFILISLALFFPSHPRVETAVKKLEPKWPRFVAVLRRLGVGNSGRSTHPGGRYNPADSK